MNQRDLMKIFAEKEETVIDALSLSLRNIKYGKGEFAFFGSDTELLAIIDWLTDESEDLMSLVWRRLNIVKQKYKDEGIIGQEELSSLRKAVFGEVKMLMNLMANIDKAKETLEWKEIWNGNGKEKNDTDKEV